MRVRGPNNVGRAKSCAKGSNTKEMLKVVNFVQQITKTRNDVQQGVQTDATCNTQQCWNNVGQQCCVRLHRTSTSSPGRKEERPWGRG